MDVSERYFENDGYGPHQVRPIRDARAAPAAPDEPRTNVFQVEDAETFAAVDEPGADPLVTVEDECAFPVGGLWIDYGDGGAG